MTSKSFDNPAWIREILVTLSATPQYVLSGNIRDQYLVVDSSGITYVGDTIIDALATGLRDANLEWLVAWDPYRGFRTEERWGDVELARNSLHIDARSNGASVQDLQTVMRTLVDSVEITGALVVDYSTQLAVDLPTVSTVDVNELFLQALQLSHDSRVFANRNPVFWIANSPGDVPTWFLSANPAVRSIEVPLPDASVRKVQAEKFLRNLSNGAPVPEGYIASFVDQTAGLMLADLDAIWRLARTRAIAPSDIEQAVRAYRVGVLDNPWVEPGRRLRIGRSFETITTGTEVLSGGQEQPFDSPVFGQEAAVRKASDILMRSALNMTAAHAAGNQRRPRGVLFFAGPTGVGKTQLAKAINRLVFDSDSPIVFDMSEFSEAHTQARLFGAPPGYVGHESGGELTTAVRQRPFSVVLFDEIEKADTSVLDKFLQILDEGRVTDGLGQTVHFTESIVIFTSNLGMQVPQVGQDGTVVRDYRGDVVTRMRQDDGDYVKFQSDVLASIKSAFVDTLQRPELLNRIGEDNIVIFDFIRGEFAERIFWESIENVVRRVREQLGITLKLSDDLTNDLRDFAMSRLDMGGRGIGTAVETSLVNPLARALFDAELIEGQELVVDRLAASEEEDWCLKTTPI